VDGRPMTDDSPLPYEGRWERLYRGRKQLRAGYWATLVGFVGLLYTAGTMDGPVRSFPWATVVLGVPSVAALVYGMVFGGIGTFRVMEFRCPRCGERFHMAGDMLFIYWMLKRRQCTSCSLPDGALSDPDGPGLSESRNAR